MRIEAVPLTAVERHWHHIAPYLEKACARTGWTITPNILWQQCRNGAAVYILARDGNDAVRWCAVIGFCDGPDGTVAYTKAFGGASIDDWAGSFEAYALWARSVGATHARFDGPRAYQKLIPGARFVSASYEVDLSQ